MHNRCKLISMSSQHAVCLVNTSFWLEFGVLLKEQPASICMEPIIDKLKLLASEGNAIFMVRFFCVMIIRLLRALLACLATYVPNIKF